MPPKRKLNEKESAADPSSESLTYDAAQALVRRLVTQFGIDPTDCADNDVGVSFSKVSYAQAAPLVGLDPSLGLQDIATFEIHCSRIPTELFKTIVADMDVIRSSLCSQDGRGKIEILLAGF